MIYASLHKYNTGMHGSTSKKESALGCRLVLSQSVLQLAYLKLGVRRPANRKMPLKNVVLQRYKMLRGAHSPYSLGNNKKVELE